MADGSGAQRIRHPWEAHYTEGVHWDADLPLGPMTEILDAAVARYPDNPATDFLNKVTSYRDIGAAANRFAKGLQALGVTKGDRIGLFLPNCPTFIIAYYGALKAGATVVNFNPLYALREVEHQILDSGVTLMVTLDLGILLEKLEPMLSATGLQRLVIAKMASLLPFPKNLLYPIVRAKDVAKITWDDRHLKFADVIDNDGAFSPVPLTGDDLAVLQYTGGTTGTPKGAMLSHGNLRANTEQCRTWFNRAEEGKERMMGVLPFFHVFAMTGVMNLSIRLGALIIMMPRFELDGCLKLLNDKKPTIFPAVPTIYTAINNHPKLSEFDLTSLKMCVSGGAALPLEVQKRFEELTGCSLVEGYGLSETAPVACCNPLFAQSKSGSIGLPLPHTEVAVVSLEDRTTPVPQGERGEVCIRGPQVMSGYWNKPDETAVAMENGWFHTGDVGVQDEQGYFFIVDRLKDLILCGGFNVYPRNVEEAIYLHDAVEEVIVAGIADSYRGQTVKAYVKIKDGKSLDKAELTAFLKDKLSPIEQPKKVEFRDVLPKTMIGKLDRKALLQEPEAQQQAG